MTYKKQLLDPRWQKKRLEILNRDSFSCRKCLDKTSTLHVHHRYYDKAKMAWEYDDYFLITLCETCHSIEESIIKQKITLINNMVNEGYLVPKFCPACGNLDKTIFYVFEINCILCGHKSEILEKTLVING